MQLVEFVQQAAKVKKLAGPTNAIKSSKLTIIQLQSVSKVNAME